MALTRVRRARGRRRLTFTAAPPHRPFLQGAHTLSRFILDEFKGEQQEITFIMNAISVAAKIIAQAVQQAGIKPLNEFVRILLLITLNFVNLLLPFAPVFSPVSSPILTTVRPPVFFLLAM